MFKNIFLIYLFFLKKFFVIVLCWLDIIKNRCVNLCGYLILMLYRIFIIIKKIEVFIKDWWDVKDFFWYVI